MASTGGRAPPSQNTPMPGQPGSQSFVALGLSHTSVALAGTADLRCNRPIVAHCEGWPPACSSNIRTARSRTSGEYRLEVCFVIAPLSQAVEPPADPERFREFLR